MLRRGTALRTGILLLLAGPVLSWLAELITAAAWQHPHYAPLHNYVSHLGVKGPETAFDQIAHSPLAWVMNTGWVVYGLILIGSAFLVFDSRAAGRRPVVLQVLAVLAGIGVMLVGIFHVSQANVDNGLIAFHLIGAQPAFVCGNLFALLTGAWGRSLGLPPAVRRAQIALGVTGLTGFVLFMIDVRGAIAWNIGLFERMAVYPVMTGHLLLAVTLLLRTAARRPRAPEGDDTSAELVGRAAAKAL
ncbi:DUF998 domain-containing protein [Streptomyces coerulescens]|uniref:DUF998 domain-containing protein n=1 Tax=Streptomyces coerulescens TaxID=29304 RepID=A0ABW0CUX2_STRCD